MTISNKSLLAIAFLAPSVAQAEISAKDLANFITKGNMEATPLQTFGVSIISAHFTLYNIGNLLIKNGYEHSIGLKTPKAMKKSGRFGILAGLACMASPIIFDTAERLDKQRRE